MNNKSKSMTIAAAVVALCMAGNAFAQDRRGDDRGERGPQNRYEQQHRGDDNRHQRSDHRYQNPRDDRNDYREGRHFDRRGYPQPHVEWRRGAACRPNTVVATTWWTTGAVSACSSHRAGINGWGWAVTSCLLPSRPG